MLRRVALVLAAAALCAACDTVPPAEAPAVVSYPQTVNYNTNVYAGAPPLTRAGPAIEPDAVSRIAILPTAKPDRPAEVIGVVDVHEPMASEDAALQRLKEKAAALGADAVLGVEFHHGEETGPTHLSGLAVRYTTPYAP
jgi:hypothetical protein